MKTYTRKRYPPEHILLNFKIKARGRDLNYIEDLIDTIPVCNKHNVLDLPERESMTMYYVCVSCRKIHDLQMFALRRIYKQLCKQYYK